MPYIFINFKKFHCVNIKITSSEKYSKIFHIQSIVNDYRKDIYIKTCLNFLIYQNNTTYHIKELNLNNFTIPYSFPIDLIINSTKYIDTYDILENFNPLNENELNTYKLKFL